MHLTPEQFAAIELCANLKERIVCVTGQAGTGKTTILREAVQLIRENNDRTDFSIQLAAPTGRAAKRIEEATAIPAQTIHRMMRFSMPADDEDFGLPAHTRDNPLPHDVIFIDEASMLTSDLRRQVIDAMKGGSAIRFFGDINQLPPIPPKGQEKAISPFAQDLKKFPSIILSQNFRSNDGIIAASDRVIKGMMPMSGEKVQLLRVGNGEALSTLYKLADKVDFTRLENQIITPIKTSKAAGAETVNNYIQQRFNPNKDKINVFIRNAYEGTTTVRSFKRDDKIIWNKNDYNLSLFNGTIGRVLDFSIETGSIFLNIDDRDIEITNNLEFIDPITKEKRHYDPRTQIELAYAVTTHKAQGSQFDTVCYVIGRSRVATRQNVYTAVTRAKENLYIINVGGALANAISTLIEI